MLDEHLVSASAADPHRRRRLRVIVARIAREPLCHFVLLGAALWGLNQYLQLRAERPQIRITQASTVQLAEHFRQQYGVAPTAPQLEALVDAAVTEEVHYRAALELGLDKDDEIVRRRLIQKYEFVQQDLVDRKEPTQEQLRSFYLAHAGQYRLPERITFTHVYFSPDALGEEAARDAARSLGSTLNRQRATRAADQGDRFPGPRDIVALSGQELARIFGRQGLAEDVFATDIAHWSAPLRSGLGWHTVYVSSREPSRETPFDAVRERVRDDYLEAERNRQNAAKTAELRSRYGVVRE